MALENRVSYFRVKLNLYNTKMKNLVIILSCLFSCSFQAQCQEDLAAYNLAQLDSIYQEKDQARRYGELLPYALASLEKGEKELDKKDLAYARILYQLGYAYLRSRDMKNAATYLNQAKEIQAAKIPKDPVYAETLAMLGMLNFLKGGYEKAELFGVNAMNIRKATIGTKHPDYLKSLNNLGILYTEMSENAKAESFYIEAINIQKETLGEQPSVVYAQTLGNLANLYSAKIDYKKAAALYIEAKDIFKAIFGDQHPVYAQTISNLGGLYAEMQDYAKAESLLLEALALQKKVYGEQHPSFARSLSSLASLYQGMNDYERAEMIFLETETIQKNTLGVNHPLYIKTLNSIATLYRKMKLFDRGWGYVLLAVEANANLKLSKNINKTWIDSLTNATYISFSQINNSLTIIYDLLNMEDLNVEQQQVIQLAITLLEQHKNEFTDDEDKLVLLERSGRWVLTAMHLLDKDKEAEEAWNIVEQNKSVLLMNATSTKKAYSFGFLPDSLINQEKRLQQQYSVAKAQLAENRNESEKDNLRNVLNSLNVKIDKFKQRVEKDYPKYAALKYKYEVAKVEELQTTLDKKTAVLEYLLGDSMVYILYADQKQVKVKTCVIANARFDEKVKSLHHSLSDYQLITKNQEKAYTTYSQNAYWFYQNLVAPVLENSEGIEQLMIVTDGKLGHLPFETFLVEEAPQKRVSYNELHYLIKDYKISYNYSATLWKENKTKKKQANNGKILGIAANYTTQLDSSKQDWRLLTNRSLRSHLGPLPAARKEVEALSEQFVGYFGFDDLAVEAEFKAKAKDYAVIHLAMHGLLNSNNPMLSSLAFTEDGDSLENNFLQAHEISKLELNADLVVLSACETGYGKFETGNGISSLARAFMYAGVPSMIVSLWQVNDQATSMIMSKLYTNLAEGMNKDAALSKAKLDYIQSAKGIAAHPAFWSAFVLMGNENPVSISKKGGFNWLGWGLGIGALVFFVLAFGLRKSRKEVA